MLLRNNGDGTFADATDAVRAGGPASSSANASDGRSNIAAFGDFVGDGHLDIVSASSAFDAHPEKVYLLRNWGDGTFEDVTDLGSHRWLEVAVDRRLEPRVSE